MCPSLAGSLISHRCTQGNFRSACDLLCSSSSWYQGDTIRLRKHEVIPCHTTAIPSLVHHTNSMQLHTNSFCLLLVDSWTGTSEKKKSPTHADFPASASRDFLSILWCTKFLVYVHTLVVDVFPPCFFEYEISSGCITLHCLLANPTS